MPAISDFDPADFELVSDGFNEGAFRDWYSQRASQNGLDQNPDSPEHHYDYRAAYSAGAEPDPATGHWPSQFKHPDHPNRFVRDESGRMIDTISGVPVDDQNAGINPDDFQVLSEDEARRALYRPSAGALRLQQQAQRESEQQPDQSTVLERLALGAGLGARGLESSLGGLFNLAGLTTAGRALQANARAGSGQLADASETLAGQNPSAGREWAEQFGSMATQQIPSLAAAALARGNPIISGGVAGLQTAGQVQDQAEQAYEAQGLSPDEATSRARLPSLTSGAITGALTALMPGGTERLAGMMFGGPELRNAAREGVYGIAKHIFGEALHEAPEEMLDQLGQDVVAHFSYDPNKPLSEILSDVWEAGGWGVGTAAGVGTLAHGMNAADRAFARPVDPANAQTGVNLRMPQGATVQPYSENPADYAGRGVSGQEAVRLASLAADTNARTEADAVHFPAGFDPAEFEVVAPAETQTELSPSTSSPVLADNSSEVSQPQQSIGVDEEADSASELLSPENRQAVYDALISNMQRRVMNISDEDFNRADPHLQSVLGAESPSWSALADAGLIESIPQKDGTVDVMVPLKLKAEPTVAQNATTEPPSVVQKSFTTETPPVSAPPQLKAEKARTVSAALMSSPALQGLNFQVEVTPATSTEPGQLTEMGSRLGNLITVAENADETALPHEVAHILFDALPPEVKATIEAARVASLQPGMDPRISGGQMTSEEFQAASLPIEHYPLSSPSEFLAHAFGDKFAQQALAKADPTIIGKLKRWLAGVWSTLKRTLNIGQKMDRVVQDLIDGHLKLDPAQSANTESQRQSTFVTSAEEAKNSADLANSVIEQKIEGESQLAQAADVVNVLDQFGVNNQSGRVQEAFDYGNWQGIRNTGEQLNQGRESYQQMKARLAADPYRRARLAGEAGQSILRFGEILQRVLDDSAKAFTRLNSRHMQDFTARVQAKAAAAQASKAILTTSKSMFDSAIAEANKALKQEARTDRDMAVLHGEIRGIKEASESTVAMEQTLNDMTTHLATWPNLLTGQGGARAFLTEYKARKQTAGQPIHNENLLKWASYILAKSPKLAAQIQAANLAQQSGLRAQLNGMARQLADDFSKNPVATVRRALRERSQQVKDATTAEFAFRQLEADFLSELEPHIAAVDAGGIAAQIKADPAFTGLRKEILNDQTAWGQVTPGKAMSSAEDASSTITLPVVPGQNGAPPLPMSGATVGLGHEVLDGSTANLRARWNEHRQAIDFLENWLTNPANADDPMRRYHAHNLDLLKNYYGAQQHLMPENQSPLWGRAYSMISTTVSKSGSRLVGQARSVLQRADQMHKWSRDWFERAVHTLPQTQRAAITSHGIKWNNLTGRSIVEANRIYQQRVGQELTASWARQQGGYNVGDTLSSGDVVTREDMAHLEAQSKAGFESLNLAAKYDQQITADARGLKNGPNYRSALRTSPYLVPRMFDYTLQAQAKAVADAFKAEPSGAPRPTLESALNRLWPQIGLSLVVDRNPEFSKKTIFDGQGNGFEVVANQMRGNPFAVPSIDALANALASVTTMTVDQAKGIVLDEFGRIVQQWSAAVEEKVAAAEQGGKSGEAKNSFTQARGDALAPWTFYRSGFTTTDDISNHAAGMQSVAVDRVVASLDAINKDLQRQQSDLDAKTKEFERQGKPNAQKAAIAEKELERRRGQTFDTWEGLKQRRGRIQSVLNDLNAPSTIGSDFDVLFNRGAGALVGSLIGNVVTTMKNVSSIFLGRQLRAAGMDELNTTLRGALFTKSEALKILGSFGFVGIPKSVGYLLRGMARGVPQLLKGNARQAYLLALRDVIRELSVNVPRRLQSVREMEAAGVYQLPDAVAKFDNQILGSILYRGGIPANEFQGAAKVGGYAAGIFEATLLAVTNAGFPTMGDAAVNGAMWNAVNSRWGPVQGMEDSLRKLFANWTKGGLPRTFNLADPADPVNRLSPKELGLTEQTLSNVRRTYEMAGMSFDERAATFLRDLQANPQSTAIQFLSPENRQALSDTLINKMNRGTFSNAPLKFKDNSFLSNMIRPLYGWNVRSFADWEESMAIPTNTETGRMRLWGTSMALAAVALAMTGGAGQLQDELMARMLKRGLYGQESANRLPWEEKDGKGHWAPQRGIAGWTRLSMESVPLLGILGNLLIPANNPARASFEPTLALWESGKSMADWVHGIFASGNPFHGLPELLSKFSPDSRIVLNRLESQKGRRLGSNAVADLKRFAPPDLVRPQYKGGGGPGVNEASPWLQKMDNAAMRQDKPGFVRAAQEAVQAERRMGKADPVRVVQNAWRSRNPETRALTRRLTPQERAVMLRNAGSSPGANLADEITTAQTRWAQAGALIGVSQRDPNNSGRISLRAPSLSRIGRGMPKY